MQGDYRTQNECNTPKYALKDNVKDNLECAVVLEELETKKAEKLHSCFWAFIQLLLNS